MAQIQGIGGVFIESDNAASLAKWYGDVLGIEMEGNPEEGGFFRVFWTRDVETSVKRANPVFAINQSKEPGTKKGVGLTINFRVDNLDAYLDQMREKKVEIDEKILVWEYGKHAWIHDLDGNRIELYEEILMDEG